MVRGGQFVLGATAVSITTALNLSQAEECKNIDISGRSTNANSFYIGGRDVTNAPANAWYEITTSRAYFSGPLHPNCVSTDDIFIVGTNPDIAMIGILV